MTIKELKAQLKAGEITQAQYNEQLEKLSGEKTSVGAGAVVVGNIVKRSSMLSNDTNFGVQGIVPAKSFADKNGEAMFSTQTTEGLKLNCYFASFTEAVERANGKVPAITATNQLNQAYKYSCVKGKVLAE